jgi:hypothetical protein
VGVDLPPNLVCYAREKARHRPESQIAEYHQVNIAPSRISPR